MLWLTLKTGIVAKVDFANAKLATAGRQYRLARIGAVAQELVIADGLENWVKQRL